MEDEILKYFMLAMGANKIISLFSKAEAIYQTNI